MDIVYLGLGSNVGDRRQHLEQALSGVRRLSPGHFRCSSLYENAALLPPGAPASWNRPYYNLAVEIETQLSPPELLTALQKIEDDNGRRRELHWQPRTLDIDIVFWPGVNLATPDLTLPHPALFERAFVLDPLAEIAPRLDMGRGRSALSEARGLPHHQPRLMGILNLTPDSFSDGGRLDGAAATDTLLDRWDTSCPAILDIGGESTRPGAERISEPLEWQRIEPTLTSLRARYHRRLIRPRISVDTHKGQVAARALELGADIINDVSGLQDPRLLEVIQASDCQLVVMHSLTVPADPKTVMRADEPVVPQLLRWFEQRLAFFDHHHIARERLIFDPGIGFGKTTLQSYEILKSIRQFHVFDVPLMVGHSRKSLLHEFTMQNPAARDLETVSVSLALIAKGVEILRVHDLLAHQRAVLAWNHTA